jgi:hypothetical protein
VAIVSCCMLSVNMFDQGRRGEHTLRCPSLTFRWLLCNSEHVACRAQAVSLQVGLGDVEYSFPSVEPFGCEHLGVLGKTQSRQAFFQVAHVEGHTRRCLSEWYRGDGGGAGGVKALVVSIRSKAFERWLDPILPTQDGGLGGNVPYVAYWTRSGQRRQGV